MPDGTIRLRLLLRRDKADAGYSWQRQHFNLDKLTALFRNFVPMKTQNIRTPRLLALFALGCFALSPMAQAVNPPPDGGYPGGNTAEGTSALLSLTTGTYNTAVGLFSLLSNTEGNFNTAIGAGTLLLNTADENTATGAGALLSNTSRNRQHG